MFQVTTPNVFYHPPIKAEIWSSSVPTAKPPSAQKEVLVSTDEENIPLNTKPMKMCRGPKNGGAKKSSHSWLNVRPLFLHTSQITTSFYNHTSPTAQLKASKASERVKGIVNCCNTAGWRGYLSPPQKFCSHQQNAKTRPPAGFLLIVGRHYETCLHK